MNGSLSSYELLEAFREIRGGNFDEGEVRSFIKMADTDGSGEINLSEWVAVAMD